ncbi:MAG: DUF4956 domain-containing protein, partial [Gemmatimonadota bacterium]
SAARRSGPDRSGGPFGVGRGDRRRYADRTRSIPIFRLLGYYVLITVLAWLAMRFFPPLREAFLAPLSPGNLTGISSPVDPNVSDAFTGVRGDLHRTLTMGLVIVGALLLVLPIAWVYTFARRLRYNRSLVHSLIMLPPVVAGAVMVVKNSLALAFSLAGIVAAVRFRTTVKDPKDAVHVFLVMAIGLAAGVQALDIAMLLSVTFALIVLVLWKYDLEVYADDEAELLSVGDSSLMLADTREGRARVQRRMEALAEEIQTDGILLIHTTEPDSARQVAEVVLSEVGKNWLFRDPPRGRNGVYTLEAVVRLRKKMTPVDLLGELEDRWSPTVAAAEYVPYEG